MRTTLVPVKVLIDHSVRQDAITAEHGFQFAQSELLGRKGEGRSPVENLDHIDEIDFVISEIEQPLVLVPFEPHASIWSTRITALKTAPYPAAASSRLTLAGMRVASSPDLGNVVLVLVAGRAYR
jgi:hypothetical protein